MATQLPSRFVLRFWAIASLAIAAVTLYITALGPRTYPEEASLEQVSGSVASAERDRYGIKFRLSGDSRTFFYARKSGELEQVASLLRNPSEQPLSLLVAEAPQKGFFSAAPFFQVHALSTPQRVVRSYDRIRRAWNADYLYGYLVVLFALLAATYLERVARRAQPDNPSKLTPRRGPAKLWRQRRTDAHDETPDPP